MLKNMKMYDALTCAPQDTCTELAKKMREKGVRHIYVADEHGHPMGIISQSDICNRVVAEGKEPGKVHARDFMTAPIEHNDLLPRPKGRGI